MKPYEWMVNYTPQTRWIEGHGKYIWLAEVFGMLGGGLWLASLYFDSMAGLCLAWVMAVVVKGALHMAHLGQPARCWRLLLKPRSSWLARGLIFVALFALAGLLQIAVSFWLPGSGLEMLFKVCSGVLAFLVAAYSGFVMNYVNGIPFWNSALLPLLFVAFGMSGGLALMLLVGSFGSDTSALRAVGTMQLMLMITALLTAVHLWTALYMGPTARRSVLELTRGSLAITLWIGVVVCGMAMPALIMAYVYFSESVSYPLFAMTMAGVLIGVFSFNYCLLKAAFYRPLTPMLP